MLRLVFAKIVNRQGSGCEKLISRLIEMISAALYTFEHGESDSKMGPKEFCFGIT